MDNKRIATILLIVGAIFIIAPMILNRSGEELTGILKSITILGAGLEIIAGIFYAKSRKKED
jgi:hypothetical protein